MTAPTRIRRLSVSLAVLFAVAFGFSASGDEPKTATNRPDVDFVGKIVVLIIDESNAVERRENTEILEGATVHQIGNRYFVTGAAYSPKEAPTNWRTGADVGVAWDKVQVYYAYTPEQFKNYEKKMLESVEKQDE